MFVVALLAMCLALPSAAQSPGTPSDPRSNVSGASSDKTLHTGVDGPSIPSCYYMPHPPYTKEAKTAKFQGVVLAEGVVMLDGRITNTRILKSPGMGLDESVLSTMKKWKCRPATHDGKQVPALVQFEVNFQLNSRN